MRMWTRIRRTDRLGIAVVWGMALAISACANSTTYLKNEKTGAIVKCGGNSHMSFERLF
jgi:uncharacterized RmlC-like cupin family protein